MRTAKLQRRDIGKVTSKISSLDQGERSLVRDLLYDLYQKRRGLITEAELHKALIGLRKTYEISDIDRKNIEHAFFG